MSAAGPLSASDRRNALAASFLGWALDAFDFFILTFVLAPVAKTFGKGVPAIALTLTASLAMRPVGALVFGVLADRYGRRIPLMINVVYYAVIEILSGLAPDYRTFLVLRLLYGIGMGGEWGVGASLAMESAPVARRGLLSGLLQEGYAFGFLLAAVVYGALFPSLGWRPLFFVGGAPALLAFFIRRRVKESPAWERDRVDWASYRRSVRENLGLFAYLALLMTMMNLISHGTQDLYPTFLQKERGLDPHLTALATAVSMLGAIAGGLLCGLLSDRVGRRRAMVAAVLLAALLIPLWIATRSYAAVLAGAFAMQFAVQGAWGVIPAHINELSPPALRGFFPGFAYQIGVLFASGVTYLEASLAQSWGYARAMATIAAAVLLSGALVIALGRERHGYAFEPPGR